MTKARKSSDVQEGNLMYYESEETTHYSVVDKWGNAVSVTTTVNGWFGNGIVVDDSGFLLNNEMDDFPSKPGHPNKYGLIGNKLNSIEPNKKNAQLNDAYDCRRSARRVIFSGWITWWINNYNYCSSSYF